MGRLTTRHSEFQAYQQNYSAPGWSSTSFTPGTTNAKGSWTDLFGGLVSDDSFGLWLSFFQQVPGAYCTALADIGIDRSGGTSYSVLIPNLGFADAYPLRSIENCGFYYYFPVFIPAGSRLAVRAQQSQGTAVAARCDAVLMQKPSHPEYLKYGSYVDAVGVDTANSRGTVLTAGSGQTKGAWHSLGAAPRDGFFVQPGAGVDDSAKSDNNMFFDWAIGNGTSFRVIAENLWAGTGSQWGSFALEPMPLPEAFATVKAGDTLYARALSKLTPDLNVNAMAYIVGGG